MGTPLPGASPTAVVFLRPEGGGTEWIVADHRTHPHPGLNPISSPPQPEAGRRAPGGSAALPVTGSRPAPPFSPQRRSPAMEQSKSTIAVISAQSPAQETDEVTGPVVVAVDVEDEE
ncbi:hypothetical protein GCM10010259_68740 [Streptomyces daghestanicus]|uniref:Uncharacterized protein n=1 Tax=Streptomyces daghestanicus TaxID=66885 RepID=A0ABQ3Q7J3_9ACTN|nr:hypothetical protein GCM10010259_68740 [Streptomyces daghestanicus]GHI33246.1 hypothetical protein Sdagh_49760 [Streptomyces daghestanicus]